MFGFVCKELLHLHVHGHGRPNKLAVAIASSTPQSHKLLLVLRNFRTNPSSSSSIPSLNVNVNVKSTRINQQKQQSFALVSYLIENCGLSPESAVSASKYLTFKTRDKPDSAIALFKEHGFSKTQIATLIRRFPPVLTSNVDKTLLPKLNFFYSKGFSTSHLTQCLSKHPTILGHSLEEQIIPCYNLLRDVLQSDGKAIHTINKFPRILSFKLDAYILPNILCLRKHGVPECNIVKILAWQPKTFCRAPTHVEENVEKLKEMGSQPHTVAFVTAVCTLGSLSKSTWERKLAAFNKSGWSRKQILEVFVKFPNIMNLSADKIMLKTDFLVNTMGLRVSVIARRPRLLSMSLEKRLVPRGLFALDLLSKGLANQDLCLTKVFEISEKLFLKRFVYAHQEKAYELLKLYKEKFNLSVGLGGKLSTSKS